MANEETDGACLYENLKQGDYYRSNLKGYPYLRCYDVSLRCMLHMSFLASALNNCGCFYNSYRLVVLEDFMKGV